MNGRTIVAGRLTMRHRLACAIVLLGAVAVVLAVVPYKAFDLDRFFIPKELVLHVTAGLAALALLAGVRRLELSRVDTLLAGYLAFGVVSAFAAPNWWLATRALAISFSAAAVFWSARAVAAAGGRDALVAGLVLAVVLAAVTALLQAYGVESQYVSLNRAPGGTLGNRNFVAHLVAIGAPVLLMQVLRARGRFGAVVGAAVVALATITLVLSRTRAAWLALVVSAAIVFVTVLARWRLWREAALGARARLVLGASVVGVLVALLVPNTLNWKSDSPYLDSVRGVVNYHEGSGRGRLVQYRTTLRMAAAHPVLGVGPGNWSVRYPSYAAPTDPSLNRDDRMTANPWPSSDWAAFISERGIVAFALLVLAFLGLGVGALVAVPSARSVEELIPRVALLATLAATAVVGAFDAVLLLPAPALIVWALLGALAPRARVRSSVELVGSRRGVLIAAVIVACGAAPLRAAMQIGAMSAFDPDGRIAEMERAARLDPGSYRVQVRLAEVYARRGRCADVRVHGARAHALFPNAPEPRRLLAACRGAARGR